MIAISFGVCNIFEREKEKNKSLTDRAGGTLVFFLLIFYFYFFFIVMVKAPYFGKFQKGVWV